MEGWSTCGPPLHYPIRNGHPADHRQWTGSLREAQTGGPSTAMAPPGPETALPTANQAFSSQTLLVAKELNEFGDPTA